MANTKPVGVAFSDPELVSGTTITSAILTNCAIASPTITGAAITGTFTSTATTDAVIANATAGLYFLTGAITAGTTTTTAPAGSLATTTNATGAGKLFISKAGKWEFPVVA